MRRTASEREKSAHRRLAACAVAALCAFGRGASAGDGPTPALPGDDPVALVTAFEGGVKAHLKDRAVEALVADTKEALARHGKADGKVRERYGAALTSILRGCTDDGVQKAAIVAIGETKDAALFPPLRPFLAQPNKKETPPLLLAAVDACGKLVADEAVPPLIAIVKDSKSMPAAQAAMKALGSFGGSKRMRATIVKELSGTVGKDRPGVGRKYDRDAETGETYSQGETRTGEEGQNRWASLAPALVEAFNRMTGQSCGSAEEWLSLVDKYKNRLQELFPSVR